MAYSQPYSGGGAARKVALRCLDLICQGAVASCRHSAHSAKVRQCLAVSSRMVRSAGSFICAAMASHWVACQKHSKADFIAPSVTGVSGSAEAHVVVPLSLSRRRSISDGRRWKINARTGVWLQAVPRSCAVLEADGEEKAVEDAVKRLGRQRSERPQAH